MMKELNMTPYVGIGDIKLMAKLDDVRAYFKANKIPHQMEVWPHKGCTPEVPWTILRVEGCLSFFFAKGFLWKIEAENDYAGSLPNGIKIGMSLDEARRIDPSLNYDDWNEDWQSEQGYWIIDFVETGKIVYIGIFIKEVLDEDLFDAYEWAKE